MAGSRPDTDPAGICSSIEVVPPSLGRRAVQSNRLMLMVAVAAGVLATILAFAYINSATSQQEAEPSVSILFVANDLPANHVLDPWPRMGCTRPCRYLPMRGPSSTMPARPAQPPTECTTVEARRSATRSSTWILACNT